MTTWHLNEDISYCELDGRLIFLDIGKDRYFQLSRSLEQSFRRFMEEPDGTDISSLSRHSLFSSTLRLPHSMTAPRLVAPTRSVLEAGDLECRIPPGMILSVFVAVALMRRQLQKRHLKSVLKRLSHDRDTCTGKSSAAGNESDIQQRLVAAATVFNRVRPYVPIEARCLIDSLSMVRFLAKLGLRTHLVMGVARDPFSAHAWVQRGSLVLNDTVGNVRAHVPIRVI